MSLVTQLQDAFTRVATEIKSVRAASVVGVNIRTVRKLTRAEFDALATKDVNTFYVIVG